MVSGPTCACTGPGDLTMLPGIGKTAQRAREARAEASESLRAARDAKETQAVLKERLDRLTLVTRALWSFLRERQGLTPVELQQRMRLVEAEADPFRFDEGPSLAPCPQCQHRISSRDRKCVYCGADNPQYIPF